MIIHNSVAQTQFYLIFAFLQTFLRDVESFTTRALQSVGMKPFSNSSELLTLKKKNLNLNLKFKFKFNDDISNGPIVIALKHTHTRAPTDRHY